MYQVYNKVGVLVYTGAGICVLILSTWEKQLSLQNLVHLPGLWALQPQKEHTV